MSEVSVRVKNLGKKFLIGHKKSRDLRQSFGQSVESFFKKDHNQVEEFWALKDLNFEIKKGQVVGIIGRNGAGKSTLLKILSRITYPTTGRFEIEGRVSSLLEVGTGFHSELTGRENVFVNGTILGMRRGEIKKKFDEIVAFSGVENFIDTPVKHYSSGMKVRLAFSVAAHLEPEILIIDEVLAVGDAEFQRKCLGKMGEVSKSGGRTILFVSHNMSAVEKLCTTGFFIDNGGIKVNDTIQKVIQEYLAPDSDLKKPFGEKVLEGSGIIKFKKADLISPGNARQLKGDVSQVDFNSRLRINLRLESETECNSKLYIAITIFDVHGTKVSTLDNLFVDKPFLFAGKAMDVSCEVKKFNLNPGTYYCSLWCSDGFETIQKIDRAVRFEVLENNYLGTGKCQTSNRHGAVYLDQEWQKN